MEQGEGTSASRNAGAYVLLRFLMQAHEVKGFGQLLRNVVFYVRELRARPAEASRPG